MDHQQSRSIVLRNMVGPEDVDEELEREVTDECSKYGAVEKVVIYQERQSERAGDVVIKIFILFQNADGTVFLKTKTKTHSSNIYIYQQTKQTDF